MTRVIALKHHNYAQKPREKGEIYEARPMDVRLLRAMKYAEPYTPPFIQPAAAKPALPPFIPEPEPEPAQPEPVVADAPVEDPFPETESMKPRRRYRRRDMKAED